MPHHYLTFNSKYKIKVGSANIANLILRESDKFCMKKARQKKFKEKRYTSPNSFWNCSKSTRLFTPLSLKNDF